MGQRFLDGHQELDFAAPNGPDETADVGARIPAPTLPFQSPNSPVEIPATALPQLHLESVSQGPGVFWSVNGNTPSFQLINNTAPAIVESVRGGCTQGTSRKPRILFCSEIPGGVNNFVPVVLLRYLSEGCLKVMKTNVTVWLFVGMSCRSVAGSFRDLPANTGLTWVSVGVD